MRTIIALINIKWYLHDFIRHTKLCILSIRMHMLATKPLTNRFIKNATILDPQIWTLIAWVSTNLKENSNRRSVTKTQTQCLWDSTSQDIRRRTLPRTSNTRRRTQITPIMAEVGAFTKTTIWKINSHNFKYIISTTCRICINPNISKLCRCRKHLLRLCASQISQ